ncbi:MAG: hypothetical protein ACYDAY_01835 [Candidatus Dormibacteria bacterium]
MLSRLPGRGFGPMAAALMGLSVASCGNPVASGPPSTAPSPALQVVFAGAELVQGPARRVAFGVLDASGIPVTDATLQVLFIDPSRKPAAAMSSLVTAPYLGDLLEGKGTYVTHQDFPHDGVFTAQATVSRAGVTLNQDVSLQVSAQDPTPAVGAPAPASHNLTASQVSDIHTIDTSPTPDDMHDISIADALAQHLQFVVFFGSPGFCRSATCAPELNVVKALEVRHRDLWRFIHVETYRGGRPDANQTVSDAFAQWNLSSDPWVFVVGSDGLVRAKFDGPTTAMEIEPALA